MSNTEKSKLYWAARRGMLELDIFLMPFVENQYELLADEDKRSFRALVECTDMELYVWLSNKEPAPEQFTTIVNKIRKYASDTAKNKHS